MIRWRRIAWILPLIADAGFAAWGAMAAAFAVTPFRRRGRTAGRTARLTDEPAILCALDC